MTLLRIIKKLRLVALSLVEMDRVVDVFTPNAPTHLNCFDELDLLVRTRLNAACKVLS